MSFRGKCRPASWWHSVLLKDTKTGWILAKAQIHVHWAIIEMGYLVKKNIIVFLCFKKQDMGYVYGKKFNICITKSNVQHMP